MLQLLQADSCCTAKYVLIYYSFNTLTSKDNDIRLLCFTYFIITNLDFLLGIQYDKIPSSSILIPLLFRYFVECVDKIMNSSSNFSNFAQNAYYNY